jgi:hypothetical protein
MADIIQTLDNAFEPFSRWLSRGHAYKLWLSYTPNIVRNEDFFIMVAAILCKEA